MAFSSIMSRKQMSQGKAKQNHGLGASGIEEGGVNGKEGIAKKQADAAYGATEKVSLTLHFPFVPHNRGEKVKVDMERVKYWIANGAQPTDTVRGLIKKLEA